MSWTSADSSPPADGVYMAYHATAEDDAVWPALFEGGRWYSASGEFRADVTHWRPMPEPPE